MKTDIIKATTSDGLILFGMLSESTVPSKKIILHIHGMAGDIYTNCYYPFMYEQYPQNGFAFLAVAHRGTHSITQFNTVEGDITNIGNAYELFEECVFDIEAWVQKAVDLGYEEIWLQAHSLGPSKVLHYMNTITEKQKPYISGLILLSPVAMFDIASFESDLFSDLMTEASSLVEANKGNQILSKELWESKLSAATFINFFGTDMFSNLLSYDYPEKCKKTINAISIPVIGITGTEDEGIAPAKNSKEAMQIFESLLTSSPKKMTVIYEGAHHGFDGFEQQIINDVLGFIKA